MLTKPLLFIIIITLSCNHRRFERKTYIANQDKSEIITVINRDSLVYLIVGEHNSIPDTNYVVVNIGSYIPDQDISVCLEVENYEWRMILEYSDLIESKLDTSLYFYQPKLEEDERGIPHMGYFGVNNCPEVTLYYNLGVRLGFEDGYLIYDEDDDIIVYK